MLSVNQELQGGRYRILNQFGHEDLGASYHAFDTVLQTKVIIKETFADQPNLYKNTITRQMESLSSIKHEAFTQVHGYFSEVDRQYLVTESTEGKSLKDLLERNQKPFLLFDVLLWTEQALNALNYLHSKVPPIIHCGMTPSNLVLTENKKIKLLTSAIIKDFGAKQSDKQKEQFSELKLPYLSLELLWETLDPASQKVILNSYSVESAELLESPIDERSSVYALGATVYCLVTGKVPVNALERSIELLDGKDDPLIDPSKLNSQIPRNFSAFLTKSLELKRENRFSSVSEMRVALQPMLDLMKKIQNERQKETDDKSVREAALHQVELARQALKKQREAEAQQKGETEKQVLQPQEAPAKPLIAESIPSVPAPVAKDEVIVLEELAEEPIPASTFVGESMQSTAVDEQEWEGFEEPVERKKTFWFIPVLCAVLVLLVGGFLAMKFMNSGNPGTNVQNPAGQNEPAKTEENAPPATNQTASPNATEQPVADNPANTDAAKNLKKSAVPTPTVDKKPTPAKTATPKKKEVSVDDIINDN